MSKENLTLIFTVAVAPFLVAAALINSHPELRSKSYWPLYWIAVGFDMGIAYHLTANGEKQVWARTCAIPIGILFIVHFISFEKYAPLVPAFSKAFSFESDAVHRTPTDSDRPASAPELIPSDSLKSCWLVIHVTGIAAFWFCLAVSKSLTVLIIVPVLAFAWRSKIREVLQWKCWHFWQD